MCKAMSIVAIGSLLLLAGGTVLAQGEGGPYATPYAKTGPQYIAPAQPGQGYVNRFPPRDDRRLVIGNAPSSNALSSWSFSFRPEGTFWSLRTLNKYPEDNPFTDDPSIRQEYGYTKHPPLVVPYFRPTRSYLQTVPHQYNPRTDDTSTRPRSWQYYRQQRPNAPWLPYTPPNQWK